MANSSNGFLALLIAVFAISAMAQSDGRDADFQYEPQRPGEIDGTPSQNRDVDRAVSSDSPHPRPGPTTREVRRTYNTQKDRILNEASPAEREQIRQDMSSIEFTPRINYYSTHEWLSIRNDLTCCPPTWNYGCDSERVPLPCSSNAFGESRRREEWCCPFWPDLGIKKCKCNRCAILKPKCAKEGRCQRRLKTKSFYAICYRNGGWNYLRYITTYLPTSCYCRALN